MLANPWQMQHQRLPGLCMIISGYQKYIWIQWNDGMISDVWGSAIWISAPSSFFFSPFQVNNLCPEGILLGWNLMWMSEALMLKLLFYLRGGVFSHRVCVGVCVSVLSVCLSIWLTVWLSVSACYAFVEWWYHFYILWLTANRPLALFLFF